MDDILARPPVSANTWARPGHLLDTAWAKAHAKVAHGAHLWGIEMQDSDTPKLIGKSNPAPETP